MKTRFKLTEPRTLALRMVHVSDRFHLHVLRGGVSVSVYEWMVDQNIGISLLRDPGFPSTRYPVSAIVARVGQLLGSRGQLISRRRAPGRSRKTQFPQLSEANHV